MSSNPASDEQYEKVSLTRVPGFHVCLAGAAIRARQQLCPRRRRCRYGSRWRRCRRSSRSSCGRRPWTSCCVVAGSWWTARWVLAQRVELHCCVDLGGNAFRCPPPPERPAPLMPPPELACLAHCPLHHTLQVTSLRRLQRRVEEQRRLYESGAFDETVRCGPAGLQAVALP